MTSTSSSCCDAIVEEVDVVIIGAGIAGLAAAQVFRTQGFTCVVLEARNRTGGRIHSIALPSEGCVENPMVVDLGANYLHGCTNNQLIQPLFRMAQLLNMESAVTIGDLNTAYRGWDNPELAIWRKLSAAAASPLPVVPSPPSVQPTSGGHTAVSGSTGRSSKRPGASAADVADGSASLAVLSIKKGRLMNGMTVAPSYILPQKVADMVFLLDRVIVTTLWLNSKEPLAGCITFHEQFQKALKFSLRVLYQAGRRSTVSLSKLEKNILSSLRAKYICYVRSGCDLPATMPQGEKYQRDAASGMAQTACYPSHTDIQVYHEMIELKKQHYSAQYAAKQAKLNLSLSEVNTSKYTRESLEALGEMGSSARIHNLEEDRLLLCGFQTITNCLQKHLDIRLEHVVQLVEWNLANSPDQFPVLVTATTFHQTDDYCSELEIKKIRCRYCIITLPVGVLAGLHPASAVQFVPPLPSDKLTAIQHLAPSIVGQSTHDKIILQFHSADVFWEQSWPQLNADDSRIHLLNLHAYGKTGVLLAHVWADSCWNLSHKSDAEVVEEMMQLLQRMYPEQALQRGGQLPRPNHYIITRWSEDPFSLASYTAGGLGSCDTDRELLKQSLPKHGRPQLLFAGEATQLYDDVGQQCTHGAFLSGLNRAVEVVRDHCGSCGVSKNRPVDYLFKYSLAFDSDDSQEVFAKARTKARLLHERKLTDSFHCMMRRSQKSQFAESPSSVHYHDESQSPSPPAQMCFSCADRDITMTTTSPLMAVVKHEEQTTF